MSRPIIWREQPTRLFHVFNRQRRSCGVWRALASAHAELAKHPGGYMLTVDEYTAKLPHLGHIKRVVIEAAA